ncbi:MAG: SGNH/GDSL hydrolase family protein [Thermoleophilaceae bacterium]
MAALVAAAPAAAATPRVYVALGDSVAADISVHGYVDLFYRYLRRPAHGGITSLRNIAVPGETTATMVARGGQLGRAVRLIDSRSNIRALTLDIGGNDALQGACFTPGCPFVSRLTTILGRLDAALKRDPGRERRELMAYYNPASGLGPPQEPMYDRLELGSDQKIDCGGSGDRMGMNDQIACIGWRMGWIVVDAWPAFKAGGPPLLAGIHPTNSGHAVLARLFETACSLPVPGPGATDPDGFLAARPSGGGPGCAGVR